MSKFPLLPQEAAGLLPLPLTRLSSTPERWRERTTEECKRERAREGEKSGGGGSGDTSLSPIILAACSFSNKKNRLVDTSTPETDGPDGVTCRHR